MRNLKKTDWEQVATMYNIFGESQEVVDWKSVQSSVMIRDLLPAINKAQDATTCTVYAEYIQSILDEFDAAINRSVKIKL